jgi:hypothetical protein
MMALFPFLQRFVNLGQKLPLTAMNANGINQEATISADARMRETVGREEHRAFTNLGAGDNFVIESL